MKIELKTIQDVKEFSEVSIKYHDAEIIITQDQYRVDGKSILGIFSLNLLKPVKVTIDSENDDYKIGFYKDIERWKVNNDNELPVSWHRKGGAIDKGNRSRD